MEFEEMESAVLAAKAASHLHKIMDQAKESFLLGREERDYVAGHALDSISSCALSLCRETRQHPAEEQGSLKPSDAASKIAALSNLLGDIGWERGDSDYSMPRLHHTPWVLGELFPVAQLRPWLEEWTEEDLSVSRNIATDEAFAKLGTGQLLLARLEKWMASHGN